MLFIIFFSNDGFILCCFGKQKLVNFTINGAKVHEQMLDEEVSTLILNSDGNIAVSAGNNGKIYLHDAWTLKTLHSFPKIRLQRTQNKNIVGFLVSAACLQKKQANRQVFLPALLRL